MKKVFMIDDADFAKSYLRKILSNSNFQVIGEASNGEEGIRMLASLSPDIITVDMNMPIMDGLEFIKKFRSVNKEIKIILISAVGHEMAVTKAISAGANDFLTKPVKPSSLFRILHNFFPDERQWLIIE